MIDNLDKDSKKHICCLLSISKADFKYLFWEKQPLSIMTFIVSNFFLNSSGHKARLSSCWLSQFTSQENSESDYFWVFVVKILLWDFEQLWNALLSVRKS